MKEGEAASCRGSNETPRERETIRCIRAAKADGMLPEIFGAADLMQLGINPRTASNFLSKHRAGYTGKGKCKYRCYFIRVSERPALYTLLCD
jgi:hypothetical protein